MKGICFIEPLFHATIEGRKTQTRRIMNPQPTNSQIWNSVLGIEMKPRYKKGEILYLKEPYIDDLSMDKVFYKFDKEQVNGLKRWMGEYYPENEKGFWKNKLFMPKSAARYFIKITDVRVERLQEITEADCIREGVSDGEYFAELIDKINGKGTWESNPFVFVYDYELMPF